MAKSEKKKTIATDITVTRGKKTTKGTVSASSQRKTITAGNKKAKAAKEVAGISTGDVSVSLDKKAIAAAKKDAESEKVSRAARRTGFTTSDQDYALSSQRVRNSQISINVPGELNEKQHASLNAATLTFKNSRPGSRTAEEARKTAGRILQLGSLNPNKSSHHPCQTPNCPAIVSSRHDDVICRGCLAQEGGDVAGKTYTDRPSEYQKQSYPI